MSDHPNIIPAAEWAAISGVYSNHPYALAVTPPSKNGEKPSNHYKMNHDGTLTKVNLDEDGNEIPFEAVPRIEVGRVYDPDLFDDTRNIIEPFQDRWNDPGVVVGPPRFLVVTTDPKLTPHPLIHPTYQMRSVPNVVLSEPNHLVDLTRGSEEMPDNIREYVRKVTNNLTQWVNASLDALLDDACGKLSGGLLEADISAATTAIYMNSIDRCKEGLAGVLDKAHSTIVKELTKYAALVTSKLGFLDGLNDVIDRMGDEYVSVMSQVTHNVLEAMENTPAHVLQQPLKDMVDRLEAVDWSSEAMLNIPDEYNPSAKIVEVLKSALDLTKATRDDIGSEIDGALDAIADRAAAISPFQLTAALI